MLGTRRIQDVRAKHISAIYAKQQKHGLYAETRTFVANVQALKQRM